MPHYRVRAWRSRLQAWAQAQVGRPYEWGVTDCASLGRKALEVMFEQDVVPVRPWNTSRAALRIFKEYGGIASVLELLHPIETRISHVRAGDIIVEKSAYEGARLESVTVCLDSQWYLASNSEQGVYFRAHEEISPLARVFSLWEVTDG